MPGPEATLAGQEGPARSARRGRTRTRLAVAGLVTAAVAVTAVVATTRGGTTKRPPAAVGPAPAPTALPVADGDPPACAAAAPRPDGAPPRHVGAGPVVTGRPTEVRLCRYSPLSPASRLIAQRLVAGLTPLGRLRADLDVLTPFPQAAVHCPLDDGSAIVLRFNSGENLTAWLTGCPRVVAPSGVYELPSGVQGELTALVPAQGT